MALILFSLSSTLLNISPISTRVDGFLYDIMLNLQIQFHEKSQTTRLVVIDFDDYSIQADGRWPWTRDKLATLLENLKKAGVVVAAFDMVLSEPEVNYAVGLKEKIVNLPQMKGEESRKAISLLDNLAPQVDNDMTFSAVMKRSDVVLGYLFQSDSKIKKGMIPKPLFNENLEKVALSPLNLFDFKGYNGILPKFLNAASRAGYVSNLPDSDGVARHALLLGNYQNKTYANFAFNIAMQYLIADKVSLVNRFVFGIPYSLGLDLGGIVIPLNSHGQILIPYWGPSGTIDRYSATDILHDRVPHEALAGSIAIIGSSMILLSDLHQAPVANDFPGVEIVANIVSGLISGQILTEFEWDTWVGMIIISLVGLFYALLLPFLDLIILVTVFFVLILVLLSLSFYLFIAWDVFLPTAVLLILLSIQMILNFYFNYVLERRQKSKMNRLFGQYLPPSHIKELLDAPQGVNLEGETRDMTVFFSDIRNFTTISEPLEAKEIKQLLNTFFTPVTQIIFTHKGTIDKYVGDMVVAFWGAPSVDTDHAFHAVSAALEIHEKLFEINELLQSMSLPTLRIGMGISSGMMDVGDMGSTFRRSYTVLGDPVNLASRLQDLTKIYQVPILVSDSTRERMNKFFWCPVDKVAVVGRHKSLIIYTPLGLYEQATDQMKQELVDYQQALEAYYKQEWLSAMSQFKNLMEEFPGNHLYRIFFNRAEAFYVNHPAEDWDGTFIYEHK